MPACPKSPRDGTTAMMGMIAAAAVLLGFALLTFWTDVENMRAQQSAAANDPGERITHDRAILLLRSGRDTIR